MFRFTPVIVRMGPVYHSSGHSFSALLPMDAVGSSHCLIAARQHAVHEEGPEFQHQVWGQVFLWWPFDFHCEVLLERRELTMREDSETLQLQAGLAGHWALAMGQYHWPSSE